MDRTQGVTYPDVHVQLTGTDGNVFAVIGKVKKAIERKHGQAAGKAFADQARQQASYDHVLAFCMDTVEVS